MITLLIQVQFAHAQTSAQKTNELESLIVQLVDQDLSSAKQTLMKIVNINSGTMNFAGVKQVGAVLAQEFEAIGFETKWVDGKDFNRAGHLLASRVHASDKNESGKKQFRRRLNILMIGHLDTVFAADDDFQSYQVISETQVAGPGITDMKGGDVIILQALGALNKLGLLDRVNIRVVLTGDEEASGKPLSVSKKALTDTAKWADVALGFEDGDGDIKTAVISRRGASRWELEVSGKPAHSSQVFREDIGYGAIYETARILNEFRLTLSEQANLTFNPGLIVGGTKLDYQAESSNAATFGKSNVIAQHAFVRGDIRALSPQQLADAQQKMQLIVQKNLAHTSAKITFSDGYPPMAPTQGNKNLLALYSQVSEDLGFGKVMPVDPRKAGAADISFTAEHVLMALDGMGLMGKGGHTKDEVADIASLAINAKKAAVLIYRLSLMSVDELRRQ